MPDHPDEIEALLARATAGDESAVAALLPLIYRQLRETAAAMMRNERAGHTLQPTAVVHEAFSRMVRGGALPPLQNRAHFFGIAALAMRRVLVEHARRRAAGKRGGGLAQVELSDGLALTHAPPEEILAVNEALDHLAALDSVQASIVEMHYFVGNTVPEIAVILSMSERTVERELQTGRAFLKRELRPLDLSGV